MRQKGVEMCCMGSLHEKREGWTAPGGVNPRGGFWTMLQGIVWLLHEREKPTTKRLQRRYNSLDNRYNKPRLCLRGIIGREVGILIEVHSEDRAPTGSKCGARSLKNRFMWKARVGVFGFVLVEVGEGKGGMCLFQ